MAKNDMEIIVYKILKYLYEKMKVGDQPCFEDMCWDSKLMRIPALYWYQIISELIDNGFVKGIILSQPTKDGFAVNVDNASITMAGRDYLRDNSAMAKAKDFLGNAFELVLEQLIKRI